MIFKVFVIVSALAALCLAASPATYVGYGYVPSIGPVLATFQPSPYMLINQVPLSIPQFQHVIDIKSANAELFVLYGIDPPGYKYRLDVLDVLTFKLKRSLPPFALAPANTTNFYGFAVDLLGETAYFFLQPALSQPYPDDVIFRAIDTTSGVVLKSIVVSNAGAIQSGIAFDFGAYNRVANTAYFLVSKGDGCQYVVLNVTSGEVQPWPRRSSSSCPSPDSWIGKPVYSPKADALIGNIGLLPQLGLVNSSTRSLPATLWRGLDTFGTPSYTDSLKPGVHNGDPDVVTAIFYSYKADVAPKLVTVEFSDSGDAVVSSDDFTDFKGTLYFLTPFMGFEP